eukprot:TRINITY_DN6844_c0_g1_i2.p1 TRINITY_DN6844_c0_g1~~TRINITY_DN6844_c0_g1_i2.p1  ORF type:complete len:289 (-),score=10.95 TRINITY_DN6844_c0_g1_i2:169-954(-)
MALIFGAAACSSRRSSRRDSELSLGLPLGQLQVLAACESTPEGRRTMRRYSPRADASIKRANQFLLQSASNGDLNGVKYWLRQGAKLNARDGNRDTALILASRAGHSSIVRYLLLKSSNSIDFFDQNRDTALLNAVKGGHLDTVYVLLQHGAHLMGKGEVSIEEIASRAGHEDIMRLLVQWRLFESASNQYTEEQEILMASTRAGTGGSGCLGRLSCRGSGAMSQHGTSASPRSSRGVRGSAGADSLARGPRYQLLPPITS